MSLPTFITTDQLTADSSLTLGEDVAHHLRVLRLEAGARVRLADGQGSRGTGTVLRIAKRNATVQVDTCEFVEPLPPVHLIVPIADRERMRDAGIPLDADGERSIAREEVRAFANRADDVERRRNDCAQAHRIDAVPCVVQRRAREVVHRALERGERFRPDNHDADRATGGSR